MIQSADRIIVKPIGGLCNRLRAIDSIIDLAESSGKQVVVVWERNKWLRCPYSDLFQPSSRFQLIETSKSWGRYLHYFPDDVPRGFLRRRLMHVTSSKYRLRHLIFRDTLSQAMESLGQRDPNRIGSIDDFDRQVFESFSATVSQLRERGSHYVASHWRLVDGNTYLKNFVPTGPIEEIVASLSGRFGRTYGLHIRGTDHTLATRYSGLPEFEKKISAILAEESDATFYLATDEPAIKERLVSRFPHRMMTFEQNSYARDSRVNIRNSLVDLLCLSRTLKVFGSYFSTFSQLAAQWQRVELETVLADDLSCNA